MGKYDFWRNRSNAYGNSIAESMKNNTISAINNTFADSPFYKELMINNVLTPCRVESTDKSFKKKLLFMSNNSNKIGNLLTLDNDTWMIIDYQNNGVMPVGLIHKCNQLLKWKDMDDNLQQIYCIITNEIKIVDGTKEDKFMILPSGKFNIILPVNVHVNKLKRDNRFIFNNSAWMAVFIDRKSNDGLVLITVEEDEIKTTDDMVNEIADNHQYVYSIEILNNNITLQVNESTELNVLTKKDGIIVISPILSYESSDEDVAIVENGVVTGISDGDCNIIVSYQNVSDSVTVNVQDIIVDNFVLVISGDNSLSIGSTKQYTCKVYNNGILDESKFVVFSLSNNLADIISQDNNVCSIKAKNNVGTTILTATLVDDLNIVTTMSISITSLW